MEPAHLIAFNLTLLAALASPGPALLIAVRSTLARGRAAGICTGLGLGTMAALWTLAALLGLDTLFRLFPWAYTAAKVTGALYLLWIAVQTWRNARAPIGPAPEARTGRAFLTGFTVNLLNPKSVLFAAAVLVVIFPAGLTPAEVGLITLNHLLVEIIAYSALAWLLARDAVRIRYLALKHIFDRAAATILGALGLRLLIDR